MTETKVATAYKSGMVVKVHQKIKETNTKGEEKERVQIFEGVIIAARHGQEAGATITVRKIASGVGVEKIFPVHSPIIDKIEIVKQYDVSRAKLHFLRKPEFKRKMKEKK
jgi:large subunit ribosomal protein L19